MIYFNWFKKNNHLFNDVELDMNLVDLFESECLLNSKEFESITTTDVPKVAEMNDSSNKDDEAHEIFFESNFEDIININNSADADWSQNKTSILLNKYCENTDLPTVVNKLADMINVVEINNRISVDDENDFEVDDEIITEDQFLSNIDEQSKKDDPSVSCEKDNIVLDESDQIDILDQLDIKEFDCGSTVEVQQRMSSKDVEDLDTLFTPTMEQAKSIAKSTKAQTRECSKKMRKIAITSGEMGEFKN